MFYFHPCKQMDFTKKLCKVNRAMIQIWHNFLISALVSTFEVSLFFILYNRKKFSNTFKQNCNICIFYHLDDLPIKTGQMSENRGSFKKMAQSILLQAIVSLI